LIEEDLKTISSDKHLLVLLSFRLQLTITMTWTMTTTEDDDGNDLDHGDDLDHGNDQNDDDDDPPEDPKDLTWTPNRRYVHNGDVRKSPRNPQPRRLFSNP